MVRELFGIDPDPWQEEALEAFPTTRRLALRSSKGPGKTALEAWIAWNFLLTRPHPKVAATSVTSENLSDNLWTEMAKWQAKSPLLKDQFEWTKTRIFSKACPETWWMSARTWPKSADATRQADTLAGLHADYLLFILDEVGAIPDAVMAAAEAGLASGVESHLLIAGNPTMLSGPLYRACSSESHLWKVIEITSDPDDPRRSPRVSIQWAREQIEKYGADNPWVLVNVFGRFPPSSMNALLGPDDVRDAMNRQVAPGAYQHAARILGVDVARQGDDQTVIFGRQGLHTLMPIKLRVPDGFQVAGRVGLEYDNWDADAVFIDQTGGYGAGVIDAMRSMNRRPIGVEFAGTPTDAGFVNKRAEIWWKMAEWVKGGGSLPNDPELVGELTTPTYFFKGDKIQIEEKQQIKERLGRSPDCFVAGTMVLTPTGERPIEDLRPGDEVVTPWAVRRVVARHESVTDELTVATFSNGVSLSGKGKHPIFTKDAGWVRLDALSMTNEIESDSPRERIGWLAASLWNTGGRSSGFSLAVDISRGGARIRRTACSIAASGSTRMAPFLKAIMCIIGTAIGATTIWKILKSWRRRRTPERTCLNAIAIRPPAPPRSPRWKRPEKPRRHGTQVMRAVRGTFSTAGTSGWAVSLLAIPARSAAANTTPTSHGRATALAPAPKGFGFEPISMIAANVGVAVRSSWPTGTGRRAIVPVSVQPRIVPPVSVFNLTLDEDNAYYANGILVRNCADALALTFAFPVTARTIKRGESRYGRSRKPRRPAWSA
jgi:phage terminase large subunit